VTGLHDNGVKYNSQGLSPDLSGRRPWIAISYLIEPAKRAIELQNRVYEAGVRVK
jgi:hypothetical protein